MSKTPASFDRYLHTIADALAGQPEPLEPASLYEPQRYTLALGGKRIRPMMTMIAAGLCGGEPLRALHAAVCVEMTHTFTLIHDDIMDAAELRRGQPTVHKKYGLAGAILSGDSLFVQAMMHLNHYGAHLAADELNRLFKVYFEGINEVCEGQALDMELAAVETCTPEAYLRMIGAKTAALLETSLVMGGIVVHAGQEELRRLGVIGRSLGIAFQIQDDLLDASADQEKLGKTVGGDILEGKKTYMTTLLLSGEDASVAEHLRGILSKPSRDQNDVSDVLAMFRSHGVFDRTRQTIAHHYQVAEEALGAFPETSCRQDMADLIGFLKGRDH